MVRVLEWTPGADAKGHPHFYVWIFSPFINKALIDEWWADAIASAGYPTDGITIVVDIRAVDGDSSISSELIKYLTKDIDACGNKIAPELYAEVYRALDGRRALQASRGVHGLG